MLPGVECARKRRLHQSATHDSIKHSFCLYARNNVSTVHRNMLLNQTCPDEEDLGGEASEAKRRLDEKFGAHVKPETQIYQGKRKNLLHGLWQHIRS